MNGGFIPVNEPDLSGAEAAYLAECIASGWISSEGPFVARLEEGMAKIAGQQHGVAVMNGSVALDVAVAALGIGPGDEVILPTFTIISCAAAIVRARATPVVIDCEPVTWNIDTAAIERAITPKTKAIMVVHIYGLPTDMAPVMRIARRHGLFVIEDAAEQIGQVYRHPGGEKSMIGSFGDIATLSFYPNKHVTTGEGGMLLTGDRVLAEKCRALRNLCFGQRRFVHEELGWNFRMSNLQAAVGVAQMERLQQTLAKKRLIGAWYDEFLSDLEQVERLPARTAYADNVYWVYGVVLKDTPFDGEQAMKRMAAKGVGTRPFFWPMHEQPVLRRMGLFDDVSCPVAERIARRGFYLPSGVALTRAQAERSGRALREILTEPKEVMPDAVERIRHHGELLAVIVRDEFTKPGISFFTPGELTQQLAYMLHPAGKIINPHFHNPVPRGITFTQETLMIKRGRLRVDFFDDGQNYLESRELKQGDVILLIKGGHGFEVLEEIEMIEVKQGPYAGDQDKTVFTARFRR